MYGDDEDQTQEQEFVMPPLKNLDFVLQPQGKIKSQDLYIAFYGVSSLHVSTLVETTSPIARINFNKAKQRSLASVYQSENKTSVFLIFHEELEKMREIHFSDFISANFQFQRLFVFTSVAKGILQKDDGNPLKYLKTSVSPQIPGSKFTEGVVGSQADLLQWAEIYGVNAVVFVGIYSDYQVNRKTVDDIFGSSSAVVPLKSGFDISKQIKAYNMSKYANKIYL